MCTRCVERRRTSFSRLIVRVIDFREQLASLEESVSLRVFVHEWQQSYPIERRDRADIEQSFPSFDRSPRRCQSVNTKPIEGLERCLGWSPRGCHALRRRNQWKKNRLIPRSPDHGRHNGRTRWGKDWRIVWRSSNGVDGWRRWSYLQWRTK